ncbi:MAG: type II secretion system protein [Candidatus Omnitrophota bacterium]
MKIGEKSFTLIELMLGLSIFVVAVVSLLGAYISALILSEGSRNLNIALNDASRVLEEMRNVTFSSLTTTDWTAWAEDNGANILNNEAISTNFQVTDADHPTVVIVTVSWSERNRTRSTSLTTAITER